MEGLHLKSLRKPKNIGRQRIFEGQVQVWRIKIKPLSVGAVKIFELRLLSDNRKEMLPNFAALRIAFEVFLIRPIPVPKSLLSVCNIRKDPGNLITRLRRITQ